MTRDPIDGIDDHLERTDQTTGSAANRPEQPDEFPPTAPWYLEPRPAVKIIGRYHLKKLLGKGVWEASIWPNNSNRSVALSR